MRTTGLWVLGAFLAGCGGDGDAGSAGGSTGDEVASSSSSSTDTPSTTAITTTGPSTTSPVTDPTDPSETAASTSGVESSTTDETADTGTSSGGCTLGELDCACDEGACVDGLECNSSDVCAAPGACEDDEWGDITSEDDAHFLGMIDDDDKNGGNVLGVLTGPDDVDWFRYDGEDSFLDSVDPFRTIAASAGVRFCKFAECPDGVGDTTFPCGDGSVATTSPDGRPGCCADAVIHVPDALCGSSGINDDSMAIWIRVDQAEDACVQYAFDYHF